MHFFTYLLYSFELLVESIGVEKLSDHKRRILIHHIATLTEDAYNLGKLRIPKESFKKGRILEFCRNGYPLITYKLLSCTKIAH